MEKVAIVIKRLRNTTPEGSRKLVSGSRAKMGVRLCWISFHIVLFFQACKHSASVKYRYFYVVFKENADQSPQRKPGLYWCPAKGGRVN